MKLLTLFVLVLSIPSSFSMSKKPNLDSTSSTSASSSTSKDLIWVGKSDEAKSCEKNKGIEIDQMESDLKGAGIVVLNKKKIHDDKMRIQMCGTDKGTLNGYQIDKKYLEKAISLGFKSVGTNINE